MSSRKKAISNHCRACVFDPNPGNGTCLSQIANCTSYTCDLFSFRPTPRGWVEKDRSSNLAREKHGFGVADDSTGSSL